MRWTRWPASSASPPGCDATRWLSTSSAGCAPATARRRRTSAPPSTGWTSTACMRRSARSSTTSIATIPRRRNAPAHATRASTITGIRSRMGTRRGSGSGTARRVSSRCSPSCRSGRRRTARTPSPPRRTPGSPATPRPTTGRCSDRASHPGTSATATWPRRWRACSPSSVPIPAWWCGRTTPISETRERPRWATKAS